MAGQEEIPDEIRVQRPRRPHQLENRRGRRHLQAKVGPVPHLLDRLHDTDSQSSVDIAEIEEPCAHSVQFGGMCVTCGKDMSE